MESNLQIDGDGNHFLTLLKTETARLNELVYSAEHELETDDTMPEDVRGMLRVAAGRAKMLLRKKFITFEKLCFKNLGIQSEIRYPVTSEDLAGYWDTIALQLLQVYKIAEEVDILRKNDWKKVIAEPIKSEREKKIASKLTGDNAISENVRKTEINNQVT